MDQVEAIVLDRIVPRSTGDRGPMPKSNGQELSRDYYARTAAEYSGRHENESSAHDKALDVIKGFLPLLNAESLLDVGTGTGRALRALRADFPAIRLQGIEPVPELIAEAERQGVARGAVALGTGDDLPFDDASFDVVTSFGVLHHVPDPAAVIGEMLRVARKAVFISDSNRFGQGRPVARYLKLGLHALGLWHAFDFVRTRGRGYMVSEGDGVFYSYSVFDSMAQLRASSANLLTFELEATGRATGPWSTAITNASTVLVGAFKRSPTQD